MALDRTEVNRHSLTNILADSITASYSESKSVEIANAARLVSPPEIPSLSSLGPVIDTSCGSLLTHL